MAFNRTVAPGEQYTPKVSKTEQLIQKAVCRYLKTHHPHVIFQSDVLSGLPLLNRDKGTRALMKSMNSHHKKPDLMIFSKSWDGKYCGLALELKADGVPIIIKIGPNKGKLTTDPHVREQARTLRQLNEVGWYANFAVGYDEAIRIIRWYFHDAEPMSFF